jgi:hypothetical protein
MLHVTNGDSLVATLRATQLGGDTLSWQDVLCEGPVPAVPPADLRKVRAGFLAEHGWGKPRSSRRWSDETVSSRTGPDCSRALPRD